MSTYTVEGFNLGSGSAMRVVLRMVAEGLLRVLGYMFGVSSASSSGRRLIA